MDKQHANYHPWEKVFADNLFRPVAGGRVSIDYQAVEPALPASVPLQAALS